jgi:hypothetical protein
MSASVGRHCGISGNIREPSAIHHRATLCGIEQVTSLFIMPRFTYQTDSLLHLEKYDYYYQDQPATPEQSPAQGIK